MYFDNILQMLLKYIFKYTPNADIDGLLGIVRAYYGCVETQNRGSLHIHLLIWLYGVCSPEEYKDKIKFEEFKNQLIKYLESIISCDFDALVKLETEVDDIHPCCKSIDYIQKDMTNTENLKLFLADVYEVGQTTALHVCTPSCYKYNKDGEKICRFGYGNAGKQLIELSIMDDSGKINLKRADAFVNNFNWIMQVALRCNHDIKYLQDKITKSLAVLYYITNYTTKMGISSYNQVLFGTMAFKAVQKYNNNNSDENNKVKKLMSAIYNAAANNTEYSGALVANMLLQNGRDGTYYSSHETKLLNIFPILNNLKKPSSVQNNYVNINTILDEQAKRRLYVAVLHDYENRPHELSNLCLYEFAFKY